MFGPGKIVLSFDLTMSGVQVVMEALQYQKKLHHDLDGELAPGTLLCIILQEWHADQVLKATEELTKSHRGLLSNPPDPPS